MSQFDNALSEYGRTEPKTEHVFSTSDAVARAFMRHFKKELNEQTLPPMENMDDLKASLQGNEGLFYLIVKQEHFADLKKSDAKTLSTDVLSETTTTLSDSLEDSSVAKEFERIEAETDLQDMLDRLDPYRREAVNRFIEAWTMRQNNQPIPSKLRKRLSEDRTRYGFAFQLT